MRPLFFRRASCQRRRSKIARAVTAITIMQSAILVKVSIVPSMSRACTTVPTTVTTASRTCTRRHVVTLILSRRRNTANKAAAKTVHMAITPQAEKGVGDVKVRASITSGGLVIQRPATCVTTASTRPKPQIRCHRFEARGASPGKSPAASRGCNSSKASAAMPANPEIM